MSILNLQEVTCCFMVHQNIYPPSYLSSTPSLLAAILGPQHWFGLEKIQTRDDQQINMPRATRIIVTSKLVTWCYILNSIDWTRQKICDMEMSACLFFGLQFQLLKQLALALSTWSNLRRAGRKPSACGELITVGKTQLVHLEKVPNRNLLISVSSQGSFKYFIYAPWCHCFKNKKDNPVQTRLKSVPKAPSQCLHSLHPAKHRGKTTWTFPTKNGFHCGFTHSFGTATPLPVFRPTITLVSWSCK